jgi:MFS family permease
VPDDGSQRRSEPAPAPDAAVKRMAVLAAAAGLSTWAIDMAATQVGLPSMQTSLGISVTASQWILNITLIVLAGLVTVGGALGDRTGRLRIFRLGIVLIFAGAALTFAGGLVGGFGIVIAGRVVEGIGAACSLPASTAMLLDVFPQAERGAAQGRMMVISMTVTAFAPTVIGVIIQTLSWPYAYLLTAVAAVIALSLVAKLKYEQARPQATAFDYAGSVLLFMAVALITVGVMRGGSTGLTSPTVLVPVAAGVAVAAALVLLSLRKQHPLIQFRLMAIRNVGIGLFVSLMRFLPNVLMGAFVARYAQQVLGLSPAETGLMMILPVLAQVVAAPIAGRLQDKGGPRTPVSLGAGLLALGLVLLALGFPAQSLGLVLVGTIVGGAGFSFTNPAQIAALNQTPPDERGMVAGIFPLAGQFGTALWVALLTAGLSAFMARFMTSHGGASEAAAQASALSVLSWIGVAATLLTLVVSLMLRSPASERKPKAPEAAADLAAAEARGAAGR